MGIRTLYTVSAEWFCRSTPFLHTPEASALRIAFEMRACVLSSRFSGRLLASLSDSSVQHRQLTLLTIIIFSTSCLFALGSLFVQHDVMRWRLVDQTLKQWLW